MTRRESKQRALFAELDALYRQLPAVNCKRQCSIACGAIPLTGLEAERLHQTAHRKPRTIPLAVASEQQRCIYLQGNRCTVYDVRPLMCRIWGTVKNLSCPHGCEPERWLNDREFVAIGAAVERIGGLLLETSREGLFKRETSFTQLLLLSQHSAARSDGALDADAERTRGLRAIFGGRIIAAVDHTRE